MTTNTIFSPVAVNLQTTALLKRSPRLPTIMEEDEKSERVDAKDRGMQEFPNRIKRCTSPLLRDDIPLLSKERRIVSIPLNSIRSAHVGDQLLMNAEKHYRESLKLQSQGAPWAIVARCHEFAETLTRRPYRQFLLDIHNLSVKLVEQPSGGTAYEIFLLSQKIEKLYNVIKATHHFLNVERQVPSVPLLLVMRIDQVIKLIAISNVIVEKTLKVLQHRS